MRTLRLQALKKYGVWTSPIYKSKAILYYKMRKGTNYLAFDGFETLYFFKNIFFLIFECPLHVGL